MDNLGLWPEKECPKCGEEFGTHADGCNYTVTMAEREEKAKKALSEFSAETIDDIIALVDMRSCNTLQGNIWRLALSIVESIDSQIITLELALLEMRRRQDYMKKLIAKTEETWLGETT